MFLHGESHGQRSLAEYCPWGHKESNTSERLTLSLSISHHTYTHRNSRLIKDLNEKSKIFKIYNVEYLDYFAMEEYIKTLPPQKTQTLKKNINNLTMLKVFEVKFTKHKINRFKATKSRYYTFTMRYNHHLYLVIKHQMPFKETTMSFKQLPHFPHSLQSLKVPVLSFCMNLLFLGISHSIIRVTFCIWLLLLILLLLRFIQVVASISASLLFKAEYYIIVWLYLNLFIHSSTDGCLGFSTFWLLWTVSIWTFVYKYLFGYLFSILWGIYWRVELLCHVVNCMFNLLSTLQTVCHGG